MNDFLSAFNDGTSSSEGFPYVFTERGRKISGDVTVTKRETTPIGDGWMYNQEDPYVTAASETVRNLSGRYYACEDGVEGFLTIVSASNPSVRLVSPVSLGTSTDSEFNTGPLTVQGTDPVFIIIYSRSFSPENYICIWYVTAP